LYYLLIHIFDYIVQQKTCGGLKMDAHDRFFMDSIKQIHERRDAKEENFEMLQQQERAKVVGQQQQNINPSSNDDCRKRYMY